MDVTTLRVFLLASLVLAYLTALGFYWVFKSHISSWTVGYWTGAAVLIALSPIVLAFIAEVI